MPVFKIVIAVLVSLLPFNRLRVLGYQVFLGYRIVDSRIGFGTVIVVDEATISNSGIGWFNIFIGPFRMAIGSGSSIRDRNLFSCGYWVLQEQFRNSEYARSLELGNDTLVTSGHYFDLAGSFKLGDRSWIAGLGSQFWTHGVGVRDRNIEIGSDCYVGSAVRFAPGSSVGTHVLVAMGSVVADKIHADNALVGGVPARVLKEGYDWNAKHE